MHGHHNVHFEVQFYGHRKNPFIDACGHRLWIPALMYTKRNAKKSKFIAQIFVRKLFFIFAGMLIQKTFLNADKSIQILSFQLSRNFVFVCKFRIHPEILNEVIFNLVKFLAT